MAGKYAHTFRPANFPKGTCKTINNKVMNFLCRNLIKLVVKMKSACLILLLGLSGVQAHAWSQTSMLELSLNDKSIVEAIELLQKKTQLKFVFNHEELNNYRVNAKIQGKTLEEALDILFSDKPLKYEITGEHVIISKTTEVQQQQPQKMTEITGVVVDENGGALPGVTVMIKGTSLGTATDINGNFKLNIPETNTPNTLICSFVGMKDKEIQLVKGQTNYKITMEEQAQTLEDVVVTGYFQRKKISQTGSEVVVDGEELRKVGSLNLLQAISSFDPGVRTLENNEFGSDPNHMPEITIRGEAGFDLRSEADDSRTNPNAPLYIMYRSFGNRCIRYGHEPGGLLLHSERCGSHLPLRFKRSQRSNRNYDSPATTGRNQGNPECQFQYFRSRPQLLQPDECAGKTGIRTLGRRIYQFQK